ncbi:cytochrome c biogenesis protein CcdA [Candidatus Woesearchaeota archaeon]|nr:MAG: cytochrome c biogenesis protein CcdA [Candidatus Woesearchaeota archaeon]
MRKTLFFILFFLLILVSVSLAQSDMPVGLQKIIESNRQITESFAVKVSFFIAFAAGILGILSPCILPFLPAYFSYTFKEKKNITKMTIVFFFGFSLVFVVMGVIAGFLGEQTLSVVQSEWLVTIAGIFIIILGLMSLFGKGFSSSIKVKHKSKNDVPGTFLLGVFFALGWTACLGPILAGILGIGAILHNIGYSALLLFFYSLGNLLPLFVLSVFYDKLNLSESKFIRGKSVKTSFFGKEYSFHTTNMISGFLFLTIGLVLVLYKGTGIINKLDIFHTKQYFYSVQRFLINWEYANIVGVIVFLLFVFGIIWFLRKYKAE